MDRREFVRQLMKRVARLDTDDSWSEGLNPAQRMVLEYLEQANRFSRQPSHVAAYMGSTRGTISQTLKALREKRFIVEVRSGEDKRSRSYDVTSKGRKVVQRAGGLTGGFEMLSKKEIEDLTNVLHSVLNHAIMENDQKPFGLCKQCRHFSKRKSGGFCELLEVSLTKSETDKICVEQVPSQMLEA